MKKLMFVLCIISATVFMTSCLKGGTGSNFSESAVCYIQKDASGVVYAKTARRSDNKMIISDKIKGMTPGTFKFFFYSWNDSYGTTLIDNFPAYNVVTSGDVIDIEKTTLLPTWKTTSPQTSTPVYLVSLRDPFFDPWGKYIDDFWLFEYAYKIKEGETIAIDFYKEPNSTAAESDKNEAIVDIRLSKTGTPKEGASENIKTNIIAVDMSLLRQMYSAGVTAEKDLLIKFRYYLEGKTEPTVTTQPYVMKIGIK